jgi:hypothetical protein
MERELLISIYSCMKRKGNGWHRTERGGGLLQAAQAPQLEQGRRRKRGRGYQKSVCACMYVCVCSLTFNYQGYLWIWSGVVGAHRIDVGLIPPIWGGVYMRVYSCVCVRVFMCMLTSRTCTKATFGFSIFFFVPDRKWAGAKKSLEFF